MQVRMNTALILRSMLRMEGIGCSLLEQVGISLITLETGLKTLRLQPENYDAPQRLYERASLCAGYTRSQEVGALHILLALLEVVCMGQSLLNALGVNAGQLKSLIYSHFELEADVLYRTHSSQSLNAVAVQNKSAGARSTKYIEPQPAVSYGTDVMEYSRPGSRSKPVPSLKKRLMTPGEISQLNRSDSQPSLPGFETDPDRTASQTMKSSRQTSGTYRATSSREMQKATMLDLATRLKEKKSKTSEARRASREMPCLAALCEEKKSKENTSEVKESGTTTENGRDQVLPEKTLRTLTPISPETEVKKECVQETVKAVSPEPSKSMSKPEPRPLTRSQNAPIITRRNAQSVNETASVYARKSSGRSTRQIAGFNPFELNKNNFPMLCTYGRNLLAEAMSGKIDPVLDRDHEIDQLIDILNKRRSNNPILVGEAGVGKTAIIEGLALRMAHNEAPRGLENRTIIALDYGSMLCGTQLRGAVQERMKKIKDEVRNASGHIILFLDEIHSWLGANSSDPNSDAALELKIALSRGELMCIGASTPQELRRAFNADPAFEHRFDFIEVKAPSPETSIKIIQNGIINQYAAHHDVTYEADAIREAVRLTERYVQERSLPDKAISVLDRAGSLCERSGETEVTAKHVAQVIAQIAEVPVERLLMSERQKLLKMEEILGKRLIGHEDNVSKISNVIRRNHAGFGAQRPIGSFLFLGPTGVGKTETAKVLADYLFGSSRNIVRFDMSEFMEQHAVAKLIGSPAGYVGYEDGGLLTEALRKRPYQIVLFDEIEKAHPDMWNILLQILDEGRLSDSKGRHVDFSNTVIIMTSNLGAADVMKASQTGIGFAYENKLTAKDADNIIISTAKSRFSPELWNRIEEKLVFHPLTIHEIELIAHLLLADSAKRLKADKRVELSFNEAAIIPYLIQNGGFDPDYGARPMRQTIQKLVESRVAEWIIEHEEIPKELFVDLVDNQILVEEITPLNENH